MEGGEGLDRIVSFVCLEITSSSRGVLGIQ